MSDTTQDLPSASTLAASLGITDDYEIDYLAEWLRIFRECGRLEGIRAARAALAEARRG